MSTLFNKFGLLGLLVAGVGGGAIGYETRDRFITTSMQPCVVTIPNVPAFVLTPKEQQKKRQLYRDLAAGQARDRQVKRDWLVP